jgi:hypothetical protein
MATCNAASNCQGTLDSALRIGTLSTSYAALGTAAACANSLYVAVTRANQNSLSGNAKSDQRVLVSGTWDVTKLTQAVTASAFIPRFSGGSASAVTQAPAAGVNFAYDGVATDPMPVPPCK